MMPTLVIDSASFRYERNRWALRELSLRMEAGVLGLVGPNGAGKTTLLKMLATLLRPTEGSITWNGQDILRHPEMVRRVLGYVPQDFGIYPQISARSIAALCRRTQGTARDTAASAGRSGAGDG